MPTLVNRSRKSTVLGHSDSRGPTYLFCALLFMLQQFHAGPYALGQTQVPARMPENKVITAGTTSLVLAPGDLIDLEVFDTPELSVPKLRIGQDGSVIVPVLGSVMISGLTPLAADAAIEKRLRDEQIMLNPSVTVLVTDYSTPGIDVLGEVKAPGIYSFLGTHSLYDALAAAGGATAVEGSSITITHRDDPTHPMIVPVGSPDFSQVQNTTLVQPGDVVEVSRAKTIYVVGDVAHSGSFPLSFGRPLTALSALALAEGPNKTAKLGKASIVRKTATGAQLIPVNLSQVEKTSALDPMLQPDDVLVIPRSGLRGFLDTALPNATGAVIGAIAYGYLR